VTQTAKPTVYLSILVLTEDSASDAFATVKLLAKHLLQIVDSRIEVQHIDFEPATDEHARRACIANIWRSKARADRRSKIALIREIAGKLIERDGFVFFHFDGDTVWAKRDACKTADQFREIVEEGVRDTLRMRLSRPRYSDPAATMYSEAEVNQIISQAMPRLIRVVPHYSIEAWCLQNTSKARELCAQHHRGAHIEDFEEWEADRGILDEIEAPKERCCLRSDHNRVLADQGFPKNEAFKAGKSFASVALTMCQCEALTAALKMTYAWPKPGPVG
jgi:hypothetical protein